MQHVTNLKHKSMIPMYSMAETVCRNTAKKHKYQAYKPYSYIQYGLTQSAYYWLASEISRNPKNSPEISTNLQKSLERK